MRKYDKEELKKVVEESKTFREVLIKFERNESTASYDSLKKILDKFQINTSHFLNRSEFIKYMFKNGLLKKLDDSEIFCLDSKVKRATVKTRIIKNKLIEYKCTLCPQGDVWMGKKISLILDHENGDRYDNRLENLRFLCPNCNATLETHCKGLLAFKKNELKIKNKKRKYVPRYDSRKVKNRPTKEELDNMLLTLSYTAIGKKYGVSDVAIRKWEISYNSSVV